MNDNLREKVKVTINGAKMGMVIESKDIKNPVLLFVHGGPGMPEYFLTKQYPTHLEDYFTVVWWDQRGAGLSYDSKLNPTTMTEEQMIDDVNSVSRYLCRKFNQKRIYLMAHSWGTYLGIQAVAKQPELYAGYIAIGQMTNQSESEKRAYDYMIDYYSNAKNQSMVHKLKSVAVNSKAYQKIRDQAMHEAGIGTMRHMKSVVNDIFFASLKFPGYTILEKMNLWRGKIFTAKLIAPQKDISKTITKLSLPVYFFSGAYDYTVNYQMAKEYLEQLQAPRKGFYLLENSAHSPIFEEPDRMVQLIKENVLE